MILYFGHTGIWFLIWFAKFYVIATRATKAGRECKFDLLAHTLISFMFGAVTLAIHKAFFLTECVCK